MPAVVRGVVFDAAKVDEVISASDFLEISCAVLTADMDKDYREICRTSAAVLFYTGFLDHAFGEVFGVVSAEPRLTPRLQRKELKRQRSLAVARLQECGVLPSGFMWLLVRFVVLPFLSELLTRFIFGTGVDDD